MKTRHALFFSIMLAASAASCSSSSTPSPSALTLQSNAEINSLRTIAPELNADPQTELLADDIAFIKSQGLVTTTDQEKALAAFQK